MTLPVPLGVRFYSITRAGERWVTRFVDDVQYRSVIPGGFASATITLRLPRGTGTLANPDPQGFVQLVELFQRVQIVDLRTAEVAWEGRVEDPARQVEPDTWQIGALGSMVTATDIQRPVFYIDTSVDRWVTAWLISKDGDFQYSPLFENWTTNKDSDKRMLTTTYAQDFVFAVSPDNGLNDAFYSWRWDSHGYDQPIARFTTTHDGIGSTGGAAAAVIVGIAENWKVDSTTFSSSEQTKTNVIGTDFTDANTRFIVVGVTSNSGTYTVANGDGIQMVIRNPKVLGMRQNRSGVFLTAASNYTTDYVTVAQVVEDVVGRFLVGGWYGTSVNIPWPGSVRSQDVYIDSSDTTQILHLTYPEGATAADILNDLATKVQDNAYWAIWESNWQANNPDADFGTSAPGFRFEWATWPNNWGYVATSQDGFEGQPNGDDVYNFVSYRYPDSGDGNQYHVLTFWHTSANMAPELYGAGFTRAIVVNKDDPTDSTTAGTLRSDYLRNKKKVQNAGTLTVKRPIQLYDAGANSWAGASRMLDPWMIRPGKLVRITDLQPRMHERVITFGTTTPTETVNGTLFKVVATDYSSADNSCRMELDQVSRWALPTQIAATGSGTKTIRIQ